MTITYTNIDSSNLSQVGYDLETLTLGVVFKNGSEYHYKDVPYDIYEGLVSAASAGQYLNKNVKAAGFEYEKVGK